MRSDKRDPKIVFRDYAVLYLNKDQIEKKIEIIKIKYKMKQ